MEDFQGKYTGNDIDARLDKIKDMVGATASQDGEGGMAPKPAIGDMSKFLRGDGTWSVPVAEDDGTLYKTIMEVMKAEAVTREQYDTISSRIPANGSYIVNTVDGFNIGDIMAPANIICVKSDDMIVFMTDMLIPLYPQYIAGASITKDLVFDSTIQYTCVQTNNGFVHIDVETSNNGTTEEQGSISLAFGGDGTKALMDNGQYADVMIKDSKNDAAMRVLVELLQNVDNSIHTCTQVQYDTLKALFDGVTKDAVKALDPSPSLLEYAGGTVVSNVVFTYQYDTGDMIVCFASDFVFVSMGQNSVAIMVGADLSVHNLGSKSYVNATSEGQIIVGQQFVNSAENKDISAYINLILNGDGTKALMDDGTYKDVCQLDCVKAIKDDISELKMLNSRDYYVAGWVDGNLDPNAVEYHGDKEFANDWDFYLLDTTDNAGETTTPVGKLMRGNLLKFENGDYAPTVGITEEMRSQCDTDLYLDEGVVSLAYGAGTYDAKAEWNIDKALIQSGSSPRAL